MIHIVTGTPGTGKSTFARNYAEENSFKYIDGKQIIKEYHLIEEYDVEKNTDIIDEHKFAEVCESIIQEANQKGENLIIDSHLSQFISPKLVNTCFVTHCSIEELQKRLKQRGYTESKIKDNLDAEIFQECEIEAQNLGHKIELLN